LEKVLAKEDASVATFGTRTIHAARSGRIGSGRTCSTVGWNRVRAMRVARTTRTVHGSRRVRFRRPTPARRSRASRGCRSFGKRAHAPRALRARCGGFAAAARGSAAAAPLPPPRLPRLRCGFAAAAPAAAPLRLRRRSACRGFAAAAALPRRRGAATPLRLRRRSACRGFAAAAPAAAPLRLRRCRAAAVRPRRRSRL